MRQNLAKDKRDRMSRRRTLDRQLDQLQVRLDSQLLPSRAH